MRRDRSPRSAGVFLAALLLASPAAAQVVTVAGPYVRLNVDPYDGFVPSDGASLNETLTDEQQALLGCGPLWETDCDAEGIDLLRAEASVLLQSFPGFEGGVDANGTPLPVPGAAGFDGSIPGSRWTGTQIALLPGARSPADPRYTVGTEDCVGPGLDGCESANPLVLPSAGQQFQSEMAALSWNFLMTLVAFSSVPGAVPDPMQPADPQYFAPSDPMSRAPGQCSYAQPQYCASVQAFLQLPEPDGALFGVAALLALAARTRRR